VSDAWNEQEEEGKDWGKSEKKYAAPLIKDLGGVRHEQGGPRARKKREKEIEKGEKGKSIWNWEKIAPEMLKAQKICGTQRKKNGYQEIKSIGEDGKGRQNRGNGTLQEISTIVDRARRATNSTQCQRLRRALEGGEGRGPHQGRES